MQDEEAKHEICLTESIDGYQLSGLALRLSGIPWPATCNCMQHATVAIIVQNNVS